jgi:hypothetical protein
MQELELIRDEVRALTAAALCIRKRLALLREAAGLPPRRSDNAVRLTRH